MSVDGDDKQSFTSYKLSLDCNKWILKVASNIYVISALPSFDRFIVQSIPNKNSLILSCNEQHFLHFLFCLPFSSSCLPSTQLSDKLQSLPELSKYQGTCQWGNINPGSWGGTCWCWSGDIWIETCLCQLIPCILCFYLNFECVVASSRVCKVLLIFNSC